MLETKSELERDVVDNVGSTTLKEVIVWPIDSTQLPNLFEDISLFGAIVDVLKNVEVSNTLGLKILDSLTDFTSPTSRGT